MPRVYELPTHLQVEDQLIAGLTARQLVRLLVGACLAYGAWDQTTWLAQDIRLLFALLIAGRWSAVGSRIMRSRCLRLKGGRSHP